jgi:hypothetical protein
MDDNVVWCALILALAYISRHMLPSYYEITSVRRHSLDNMRDDILFLEDKVGSINNAVDDNEQDLMGALKKIEDMQSDIAGHLTRLDDIDGRAIVEVRAVNYANSVNTVYRHSVQVRVNGGEWADIPVETAWGTDEEAAMYIIVNKPEEDSDD